MAGHPGKLATAVLMVTGIVITPPVVFFMVALGSDMALPEAFSALCEQFSTRKQNLLVLGLFACVPLLLLSLVLWLHRRAGGQQEIRSILAWTGYLPIWLVTVWVNFEYWSDFLPARTFLGFPHGLEFVIGPLFFAPVGMAACMLVAWLVARRTGS